MKMIIPCLWFDGRAEEAMHFYVSVFPNSRVLRLERHTKQGPGLEGKVRRGIFQLDGQELCAADGTHLTPFSSSQSLLVSCADQAEVDALWEKLGTGGEPGRSGWLRDRYGVSWQIVPVILDEMLSDPEEDRVKRVTRALLDMDRIDIEALKKAYLP
jgi:predicted 3-demethylubiquinone-9 3-methyltransferase (glyoxalase superfamily)